ncbi:hypothetical protein MIMGU_mgv1a0105142mg, partial [Erythranthe guttata]
MAARFLFFLLLGVLTRADPVRVPLPPGLCRLNSVKDFLFAPTDDVCSCDAEFSYTTGVIE